MSLNDVVAFIASVIGMVVLALGVNFYSSTLVVAKPIVKAGYDLPDAAARTTQKGPEKIEPIAKRLSTADVTKGASIAKSKCATCHQFVKGGKNGTGPLLFGVLGRNKAANEAFKYSAAMAAKGGKWDYEALDAFIANPKAYVTGTNMGFAGLSKADDRASVVLYLRSLADAPAALPQ